MTRPTAFLALALLLSSCCICPEVPEMERYQDQDMSSPDRALEYFRAALRRDDARHQFAVFSEALKDYVKDVEKTELSLGNYILVRDDVKRFIEETVGTVDRIRIGRPRYFEDDPHKAEVDLIAGSRRETIVMVEQVQYVIYVLDGDEPISEPIQARLPADQNPVSVTADRILLTFRNQLPPGVENPVIHRVSFWREWKILEIRNSPFTRRLGEWYRKRKGEKDRKAERNTGTD